MTGNGQTSDVKAALLARWQEGPIEGGGLAIPRASRTTRVPLSLAQQRLWILEQLQPGTPAYNLFFCGRGHGRLDPRVLSAAVTDLPKNPSGKVDRRTLPAPGPQSASTAGFLAPRTPVEEQIARSAAEMLGVQRVGVRDDFFELGGHSLTAAQLVTALCVSFGIELAVQDMFVDPTVEHLAELVEAELRREAHLGDEDERMRSLVADMPDESVDALVRQLLTAPGLQAQTPC
jgi:acyl carrier protein